MLHWIIMIAGLIISFILLVKGADFFVDGCVSIARLLRVPDFNYWSYYCCYGDKRS